MSDPVTNVEIEDVLSSIRRLVSSDGRPLKSNDAPVRQAQPAEPERLVLTPSLRVDESVQPQSDREQDDDTAQTDSAQTDSAQTAATKPEAPELSDASSDDDWSNEVDAPDAESEDMQSAPADEFDADLAMAEVDATPVADKDEADAAPRVDPLRQRIAELEEVVARQPGQWEPDSAGGEGNSGSPVAPLPWEDYAPEDEADREAPAMDDTDIENVEDAVEEAIAKAARPPERPAERPTAKAETEAGKGNVSASGTSGPTHGSTHEEPEAGEPEAEDADDIPDNFAAEDQDRSRAADMDALHDNDFLPGNDEFLDEDALRDLVADIVRQELQGALGERITRNVRKLVRREIHRALTSQDFQ